MNIELKPIINFPNYLISDDGRVWSKVAGKWLKPRPLPTGYLRVQLTNNAGSHELYIHRLVAMAFLHNPLDLPQVNHRNENKSDNRVINLEWCDSKYNTNYGTRNERCHTESRNQKAKDVIQQKYGKPVLQLTKDNIPIKCYSCASEAARINNICACGICAVCRGEYKTYKKYRWIYISKEEYERWQC